jgi:hypothetical protein
MTLHTERSIEQFNRYHHSATYQKVQYNLALAEWFQSKVAASEWKLFSCTCVFHPVDAINTKTRFEDEYKSRVLSKIRRQLERSTPHQPKTIPYEDCYYYERYEKSRLRNAGRRNPPHIHSVIPIRTSQVHRFWSYDENRLNPRLSKDLHSIDVVQDVSIEPIRDSGPFAWLMYSTKQKEL